MRSFTFIWRLIICPLINLCLHLFFVYFVSHDVNKYCTVQTVLNTIEYHNLFIESGLKGCGYKYVLPPYLEP